MPSRKIVKPRRLKKITFPQKKYACSFSLAAGVLYLMNL
jgi:hypothetical protein